TILAALGFALFTADPSLFLRTDTSLPPFYVLVYVDDFVFATADTKALTLVKSELQKRHTCTDLGELRRYLGLQITRDRARCTITLTQSHMVHQVLQGVGFQFSSPQPTPLSTGHSLSAPPSDESVEPSGPYPELVGCLMYMMTCTRPDLAYPPSLLACYVAPGRHRKVRWDAAKRVLCYLCNTSSMGLVLGGRGPIVLIGHGDASWVDVSATQRSSSFEAEIYAGAMDAQELRWLTYLLTDFWRAALFASSSQRGQLRLAYVATRANTADIFTKALPPGDHQRFSTVLGLLALLFFTGLMTTSTTPTAATTATPTPTAATTAATEAPTPTTTPTAATTSATSTASTASTTTTPAATATTLATLALAAAALPTKSRSSPDILSTKDVNNSNRSVGGGKGGGGTPLKEGRARSATSSTYSDYASLNCKEVLLEQVDSE
ncbi:unnamed protein product, partial [Closterium sp. NIES-53]